MMWGALWDSVREGEMDPRVFVELVVNVLQKPAREQGLNTQRGDHAEFLQKPAREQGLNTQRADQALANAQASALDDESTVALLLNRVGTAMNYYMSEPPAVAGGLTRSGNSSDLKTRLHPPATAPGSDLRPRVEDMLIDRMQNAPTLGQRITYYRAFLNIASSEKARGILKETLNAETQRRGEKGGNPSGSEGAPITDMGSRNAESNPKSKIGDPKSNGTLPTGRVSASIPLKTKDKFDIVTRLLILNDPDAPKLLAELEKTESSDDAKRYAYAAKAGIPTAENKAKYWNDFINNKQISESWIEAAMAPWNSIRQSELTLPYLQKALQELPNHKRSRKIFFVNGWLGAFIGGQRSEEALAIVNKFLADNPNLDNDLRLKVLENVDLIERAVKIRKRFP